jgi:hypothetical protein
MEVPRKLVGNELQRQLAQAGIDLTQWGKGEAKTLEHLQAEVENGETVLAANTEGELLRQVSVADAVVKYISPDGTYFYLKEDRQVFTDGRERKRPSKGVAEKMKPGEDPRAAIIRGIREELGVEGELEVLEKGIEERLALSASYPGLKTEYIHYLFEVILNDDQFKSDGYTEVQSDKTTYFVWESQ